MKDLTPRFFDPKVFVTYACNNERPDPKVSDPKVSKVCRGLLWCLIFYWWPPPRSMQYAEHAHNITGNIVNHHIVSMYNKLSCTLQPAWSAKTRIICQTDGFLR